MNINIKTNPSSFSLFFFRTRALSSLLLLTVLLSGCNNPKSMLTSADTDIPEQKVLKSSPVRDTAFKVFDGTSFRPKPAELAEAGLEYFSLANTSALWGQSAGQLRGT